MASLHLVTGYSGKAHITSADQGLFNAGYIGHDEYVLANGRRFDAEILSNNAIRIYDGSLLMNGRCVHLEASTYLDAVIENGSQSRYRNDLIVMRYTKDTSTGVESVGLVVIKGTTSSGDAIDPVYNTNSILNGEAIHDMPLYRVMLSGLSIVRVEPMFKVLAPLSDIQGSFYKQNMLINGDFQCNQRGENTYDVGDSSAYTVDMWRIHQLTLNVLDVGVKITGKTSDATGYFTQFVQLGKLETTTYTISAMVDGKICTFTLTPGGTAKEKDFGKFKISALTTSTWDNDLGDYNNKLKINICPIGTNSITIKYVDLFEGSIAYPHVKEDYAIALMRCKRYIQKSAYVAPILYKIFNTNNNNSWKYRFAICFDKMAHTQRTKPSLESCTWSFTDENGEGVASHGGTNFEQSLTSLEGMITVTTPLTSHARHADCCAMKGVYVVTCEPSDA
jgi:hypothetical protein